MQVLLSHAFGNANSYNLAAGLYKRGHLGEFHTCLFAPLGTGRRWHPALAGAPIRQHRAAECFRLAMTRCPVRSWNGRSAQFVDWVSARFDRAVARSVRPHCSAVYCYEDTARSTFLRARELGIRTIYDLPTGYFEAKTCLATEGDTDPSIKPFFPALNEPEDKLEGKRIELGLADVIVCASGFTRQSLAGHLRAGRPVVVIPYGTDLTNEPKVWSHGDAKGPFHVLFVGSLSPQKGLHHLIHALSGLPAGAVRLTLAGRWVAGFRDWLRSRYNVPWTESGQVPHSQVPALCRANHVLVFPSLFDGFGLVILEAMSAGIPVIASTRSGGPDVIREAEDGMLVPAGDPCRLRDALVWMLHNRDRVADMGCRARQTAELFTWEKYSADVTAALFSPAVAAGQAVPRSR